LRDFIHQKRWNLSLNIFSPKNYIASKRIFTPKKITASTALKAYSTPRNQDTYYSQITSLAQVHKNSIIALKNLQKTTHERYDYANSTSNHSKGKEKFHLSSLRQTGKQSFQRHQCKPSQASDNKISDKRSHMNNNSLQNG
jgi:hypothetical protein